MNKKMKHINLNKEEVSLIPQKNTEVIEPEVLQREVSKYREQEYKKEYHMHKHIHFHKNNYTKNYYNKTTNIKNIITNSTINDSDGLFIKAVKGLWLLLKLTFYILFLVTIFLVKSLTIFFSLIFIAVKDYFTKKEKRVKEIY